MSWLFGYSRPQMPPPDGTPVDGGDSGSSAPQPNLTNAEKRAMEAYRFDSSALERAAQAAKELERSSKFNLKVYYTHFMGLHNTTA